MNKKSQVTIFVILGVIILFVVIGCSLFAYGSLSKKLGINNNLINKEQDVSEFIKECIETGVEKGLKEVGLKNIKEYVKNLDCLDLSILKGGDFEIIVLDVPEINSKLSALSLQIPIVYPILIKKGNVTKTLSIFLSEINLEIKGVGALKSIDDKATLISDTEKSITLVDVGNEDKVSDIYNVELDGEAELNIEPNSNQQTTLIKQINDNDWIRVLNLISGSGNYSLGLCSVYGCCGDDICQDDFENTQTCLEDCPPPPPPPTQNGDPDPGDNQGGDVDLGIPEDTNQGGTLNCDSKDSFGTSTCIDDKTISKNYFDYYEEDGQCKLKIINNYQTEKCPEDTPSLQWICSSGRCEILQGGGGSGGGGSCPFVIVHLGGKKYVEHEAYPLSIRTDTIQSSFEVLRSLHNFRGDRIVFDISEEDQNEVSYTYKTNIHIYSYPNKNNLTLSLDLKGKPYLHQLRISPEVTIINKQRSKERVIHKFSNIPKNPLLMVNLQANFYEIYDHIDLPPQEYKDVFESDKVKVQIKDNNKWKNVDLIFSGIEKSSEYVIDLSKFNFSNREIDIRFLFDKGKYRIINSYITKSMGSPKKEFTYYKTFENPLIVNPFSKERVIFPIDNKFNENLNFDYIIEISGYYQNKE
tara:strand:- start:4526 stop:6442 length:1917 start_codon:yes stop_codon:yes gene_type:complete